MEEQNKREKMFFLKKRIKSKRKKEMKKEIESKKERKRKQKTHLRSSKMAITISFT
jgi:hypothetical protein